MGAFEVQVPGGLARPTGLAGFYFYEGGHATKVLQNGSLLTLIDGNGAQSARTISNEDRIDTPSLGLTGVFDRLSGTITFTDNSVWLEVRQIAGQWLTSKGTLAGIRQVGTDLSVTSGDGAKTTGHFVDATHLILDGWANPAGNLT